MGEKFRRHNITAPFKYNDYSANCVAFLLLRHRPGNELQPGENVRQELKNQTVIILPVSF